MKVHSDATPGTLAGRLENLVTGAQREFACGRQLLEFIAADLAGADEDSRSEPHQSSM